MTTDKKPTSPADVTAMIEENGIQMIDLKFCDLPGTWQHFTVPLVEYEEKLFQEGTGFDGSSIRGFQQIHESDMLVVPDPTTAMLDPFTTMPTLSLICDIVDPSTTKAYGRDPRLIAKKAEAFLKESGVGDVSFWGPELEFFIFDSARFDQNARSGYYFVDSDEGIWNSGAELALTGELNTAYRPRHKEGYFPAPPTDTLTDLRSEAVLKMQGFGMHIEKHHHEVAPAQHELGLKFSTLTTMADRLQLYKYVIHNVAASYGKTATFMPKPMFADNGSGMHVHQSIWSNGNPLFAGDQYAGLSETCLYYIGGVIKHARALNALTNPSTNSYKRLVPGYEAPVMLAYSARNRSASIRIPFGSNPKAKRIETRFPDPTANPYLAFAALLMAGLDGIENKIHPGDAMDKDLYDLPPEEAKSIPQVCGSLREALAALDADRKFLTKGGVFDDDQIDAYIELKMEENMRYELHPHPVEFDMYYKV